MENKEMLKYAYLQRKCLICGKKYNDHTTWDVKECKQRARNCHKNLVKLEKGE